MFLILHFTFLLHILDIVTALDTATATVIAVDDDTNIVDDKLGVTGNTVNR